MSERLSGHPSVHLVGLSPNTRQLALSFIFEIKSSKFARSPYV